MKDFDFEDNNGTRIHPRFIAQQTMATMTMLEPSSQTEIDIPEEQWTQSMAYVQKGPGKQTTRKGGRACKRGRDQKNEDSLVDFYMSVGVFGAQVADRDIVTGRVRRTNEIPARAFLHKADNAAGTPSPIPRDAPQAAFYSSPVWQDWEEDAVWEALPSQSSMEEIQAECSQALVNAMQGEGSEDEELEATLKTHAGNYVDSFGGKSDKTKTVMTRMLPTFMLYEKGHVRIDKPGKWKSLWPRTERPPTQEEIQQIREAVGNVSMEHLSNLPLQKLLGITKAAMQWTGACTAVAIRFFYKLFWGADDRKYISHWGAVEARFEHGADFDTLVWRVRPGELHIRHDIYPDVHDTWRGDST